MIHVDTGVTAPGAVGKAIMGVAASDAHAVANQLIAESLRMSGFRVINLGVCTPLEEFQGAYRDHPDAAAIVIGSLNGHAYDDLRDLPEFRARGELRCPIVLGGNLSVGSDKTADDRTRLTALGVEHVLDDVVALPGLLADLAARRAAAELVPL